VKRSLTLVLGLLAIASLGYLSGQQAEQPEKLAPYFPTPPMVVEKMLTLGELRAGEVHYDLGSGDGRVVIMAAQKFGARSTGFEIEPKLIEESRAEILRLGLQSLASILQQDLLTADFTKPDLITVYLLPASNRKLAPLLERQMRPGTRIVAHDFAFREFEAEKTVTLDVEVDEDGLMHTLYFYRR
jgi:protein-L-isoaspartate O-methyltransferase